MPGRPPFFDLPSPAVTAIRDARLLALFGDSVTTDHISPAGDIDPDSPAGRYLLAQGVAAADFNYDGKVDGYKKLAPVGRVEVETTGVDSISVEETAKFRFTFSVVD